MAVSALVNEQRDPDTARSYRQVVADRPVLVSFVTVAEMRYGALKAGWGDLRSRALERSLSQLVVVQPDDELIRACASLRAGCERAGHPLGQKGLPRLRLTVVVTDHAATWASAGVKASSNSTGVSLPRARCRRRRL